MAKVVIGAEVKVEGLEKAGQSVGSFKKQLKDANEELLKMSEQFGNTSDQALAAAKRVAGLRDAMKDAKETSDLFDPGKKFSVFGNVLQTVTAGFSAATGAMGLFGSKGKEVEEVLLKVQSAMLLQQGLSAIADASKDFVRLGAIIKSTTIFQKANNAVTVIATTVQRAFGVAVTGVGAGFKALRGAIISTGIGALVVGLGILIDKLNLFGDATEDATAKQNAFNESLAKSRDAFDKWRDFLERNTQVELKNAKIRGASDKELNSILQKGLVDRIDNLQFERDRLVIHGQSTKDIDDQILKQKQAIQDLYLDSEIKSADAIRAAQKKAADERAQKAKEAADKKKKDDDDALAAQVAAQLKSINSEIEAEQIKFDNEQEFAAQKRQQLIDEQQALLQTKADLAELALLDDPDSIDNRVAKINADLEVELSTIAEGDLRRKILIQTAANEISAIKEDAAARDLALLQNNQQQQLSIASQAVGALADLAGRQTAAGKVLAIAEATINVFKAGLQVFAQPMPGIPPVSLGIKIASMVAAIATGIVTVKKIVSTKVPGVGGGGSAPTVPSLPAAPLVPQAQTTQLNQQSINQVGNAANRAYVLETDVSGNQERVRRLNRAARIN